jgi:putative nucleotidyltransferase with HDIG domain
MSKFNHKKSLALKDYLIRAAILLASVALIVYLLPHEGKFNYQYEVGKPWRYGHLIATFDFPIYKDSSSIQMERDSVLHQYQPYYRINSKIENEQIDRLQNAFNTTLKGQVPPSYLPYIVNAMHVVYTRGIISSDEYANFGEDSTKAVRIFSQNEATPYPVSSLFSTKTAYEYIMRADTIHYDRGLLQRCDLNEYITPNLIFDEEKSKALKVELLNNISYANGLVLSGQKIIDRGEIVNQQTYNILESLHRESVKRSDTVRQERILVVGQIIFVVLMMLCFTLYLSLFRKDYYEKPRTILLLFSLIVLYPIATSFLVRHNLYSVFMIPYAMAPMFVRVFTDSRTAAMTHITLILLCSVALHSPYEFILIQFVSGMAAIYSLRELSQRSQLIKSAIIVTLASAVVYFAVDLMRVDDLHKLDTSMYSYFVINGILLLFAYPLMFLIEKTFGFCSNVTLVELSNINNDLLQNLSEVAPGTFQHSMQVANLAAEVANKIGAHSQLVRTGALYHDIGKMVNPAFFTENQTNVNPHETLRFDQSAQIIIGHVTEGLRLAERYRLPKVIEDFIATHHGRSKTKYFYISYKNKFPNEPIDDALFTYPGPNPTTREQAILMMADAVEAASHSLKEYTEENLTALTSNIIDTQVNEGYFRKCPITYADIDLAKQIFAEKLKMVYHTRISYPELKNNA